MPSPHNFFLDVSLVIDIIEIIKEKKYIREKIEKEKNTLHQVWKWKMKLKIVSKKICIEKNSKQKKKQKKTPTHMKQ